ncbi:MAG: DoxX family protein [Acidimicrobiales bacterium]
MLWVLVLFALVSGTSFLFYGYETLFKQPPRGEFERYGMPRVRRFVGATQLLGGAGVLIGLGSAPLGAAAAAGLTVMMALGLIVRYRIHDAPRLMVPAASLGSVNAVLTALFLLQ